MYKRNLVFAAACVGMLLFGITLITLGAVVPGLKERFQLDEISAGTLFSILPLGILTGSFLFGPLCDQYGYKLLLVLSCLFLFVGFMSIVFSPARGWLQAGIYLFGAGGGAINGATNAVMADISPGNKTANLSLLGVFFGIGALGMPSVIGLLENRFTINQVVTTVSLLTAASGLFFAVIRFPPPKQAQGFPIAKSLQIIRDPLLILIAFFLFCQSSFEAILDNWTTTYLSKQLAVSASHALYALSLFVAGMTVTRLLYGTVFRAASVKNLLSASLLFAVGGCLLLGYGNTFLMALAGLVLLGAALAGGFPIMLGIVGDIYKDLSATAFSFVLVIALLGNFLVNYITGIIIYHYGVHQLITVAFAETSVMTVISIFIIKKTKSHK
jgi:MFS family permease